MGLGQIGGWSKGRKVTLAACKKSTKEIKVDDVPGDKKTDEI